jgi:hypothetical protein
VQIALQSESIGGEARGAVDIGISTRRVTRPAIDSGATLRDGAFRAADIVGTGRSCFHCVLQHATAAWSFASSARKASVATAQAKQRLPGDRVSQRIDPAVQPGVVGGPSPPDGRAFPGKLLPGSYRGRVHRTAHPLRRAALSTPVRRRPDADRGRSRSARPPRLAAVARSGCAHRPEQPRACRRPPLPRSSP